MYKIDRDKIEIIQVDLLEFNVSRYNTDIKLIDWNDKEPNEYDDDGKLYKIHFTDEDGFLEKDAVAALSFNLLLNAESMNTYLVLYEGKPVVIIVPQGYSYEEKTPVFAYWNNKGEAMSYFLMGIGSLNIDGKGLKLWK